MVDALPISDFLQREMSKRSLGTVTAVEAARWLDQGGLLKDSPSRPGLPLREMLRAGQIAGQRQQPNGRWYIDRAAYAIKSAITASDRPPQPNADPAKTFASDHATRFADARRKYRPQVIKCVLVAESPPSADSKRFFYFEDVAEGDSLFWQTMKALYPEDCSPEDPPPRRRKRDFLKRFQDDGFYLMDAVEEPLGDVSPATKRRLVRQALPRLKENLRSTCGKRTRIVLISAPVFDVCAAELSADGFNIVNSEMIDFPGSGGQRKFREKIARALAN